MKKILISLDYGPSAQKVAETGFQLANSLEAKIILLHVTSEPDYFHSVGQAKIMGFGGHYSEKHGTVLKIKDTISLSMEFLNKSRHFLGDDSIETITKEGDYAGAILETASEHNVDIIIMGSQSRTRTKNSSLGSVTEQVLLNSPIPILIVPTRNFR